ncbi:Phenylpyruvate [Alternaria gaisen]|uniref:Phenylpyruvate n=2 Tax=Alternaria gaisen TaxID=167740 RepID=A0ACB6F2H8_9PLEO|nr:Phenylpyruvate [Alternaria gaisen]KAB2098615.1 Phenylpyruvate [Alternaria gaisen]
MSVTTSTNDTKRAVADIFNSSIAAHAIGAAWEIGLLDAVRDEKKVNIVSFSEKHDLETYSMQALVVALSVAGVLEHDDDIIMPGRLLEESYKSKSLFHWLCLGSGGLFSRMQHVLRNENRKGDIYRDPAAIAYACRDISKEHFDPAFWAAIDRLNYTPKKAVDLGCGSGGRLMQILGRFPETLGLGVDIASPSLKVAAAETSARGFGDRLSFKVGDARQMNPEVEYADVDLLTCFMMGHDFWPRENCVVTLRKLREVFPKVHRFILGDATGILLNRTNTKYNCTEDDVPIFTLGFEFGHAMMDIKMPTLQDWEGVFEEGGWRLVKTHLIESLSLSAVFELEHA